MTGELRAKPECLPCSLKQVLSTVRTVSDDPWFHAEVLKRVMARMADADLDRSPAEVSFEAISEAMKLLGSRDPFAGEKRRYDALVQEILPDLRKRVGESTDPVGLAARLAIAGNVIDLGILSDVDLGPEIERVTTEPLARDDMAAFREAARAAKSVLYVLDNAGEVLFDRLLIEQLKRKDIACLVRAAPILNDVTREDAVRAGLDEFAEILDPGTPMLGLVVSLASAKVQDRFLKADLVIAKGQANLETLYEEEREIYFLLKAKCPVVADALGVKVGDSVLARRAPAAETQS